MAVLACRHLLVCWLPLGLNREISTWLAQERYLGGGAPAGETRVGVDWWVMRHSTEIDQRNAVVLEYPTQYEERYTINLYEVIVMTLPRVC